MSENWLQMLSNPQAHVIKQWMSEVLKDKFHKHSEITERLSKTLITQGDVQAFIELMADLYQTGFIKALKEYEGELKKIGYKVKLTEPIEHKPIFPQEKSG